MVVLHLSTRWTNFLTLMHPDSVRLDLDLVAERRFDSGVVVLRYAVRG
jgi:hypothetical protein